jgi:thymidylate kinase
MKAHRKTIVVSFSGIDGAGKSTQIEMLRTSITQAGLGSSLLTFWDDVAMFSGFREMCSHLVFGGDKGVGSPEKPIERRDKNVSSWPAMLMRLFFYVFDSLSLSYRFAKAKRSSADVVIFDRYIYDEFANLPLQQWFVRSYVRLMMKLVPKPDVAYMIDADPAQARLRKPEYPYEFLQRNRASYLELNKIDEIMTIIPPSSMVEAHSNVVAALVNKLPDQQHKFFSNIKAFIES